MADRAGQRDTVHGCLVDVPSSARSCAFDTKNDEIGHTHSDSSQRIFSLYYCIPTYLIYFGFGQRKHITISLLRSRTLWHMLLGPTHAYGMLGAFG